MYYPAISHCPLFIGIDDETLKNFLSRSVSGIRTFHKGEHVVRQGDSITFLNLLVEGIVRTEMITAEGNLVEIEFIEAVRPLAPAFIFSDRHKFPVDAIAMDKSVFIKPYSSLFFAISISIHSNLCGRVPVLNGLFRLHILILSCVLYKSQPSSQKDSPRTSD